MTHCVAGSILPHNAMACKVSGGKSEKRAVGAVDRMDGMTLFRLLGSVFYSGKQASTEGEERELAFSFRVPGQNKKYSIINPITVVGCDSTTGR